MPLEDQAAEPISDRLLRRLEDETKMFLEAGEKRHIGIEIGAMSDLPVLFEIQHRASLRAGLQESDKTAALLQLTEQGLGLGLDGAVDENHVIATAGREALDQGALGQLDVAFIG